jgi:hypothetical protein
LNKAKAATEQVRKEAATHAEPFELIELDLGNLKACVPALTGFWRGNRSMLSSPMPE